MEVLKLFGFGRDDKPPSLEAEGMSSYSDCSDTDSDQESMDLHGPNTTYSAVCMVKADLNRLALRPSPASHAAESLKNRCQLGKEMSDIPGRCTTCIFQAEK